MNIKNIFLLCLSTVVLTCAQVPKESVELSTTIGRDLAAVHESHRELAHVLFSRMRDDVNRFVDKVYAPHQINLVMARQQELANSSNQEERNRSLLLAINAAFQDGASQELQEAVLEGMSSMVNSIYEDVESMRYELLEPINVQEEAVLNAIDKSYQQIHYANSIVTGHLSSIAKVHDVQAQLLEAAGVDKQLRSAIGSRLVQSSEEISQLVNAAEQAEANLPAVEENVRKIKDVLKVLNTRTSTGSEAQ